MATITLDNTWGLGVDAVNPVKALYNSVDGYIYLLAIDASSNTRVLQVNKSTGAVVTSRIIGTTARTGRDMVLDAAGTILYVLAAGGSPFTGRIDRVPISTLVSTHNVTFQMRADAALTLAISNASQLIYVVEYPDTLKSYSMAALSVNASVSLGLGTSHAPGPLTVDTTNEHVWVCINSKHSGTNYEIKRYICSNLGYRDKFSASEFGRFASLSYVSNNNTVYGVQDRKIYSFSNSFSIAIFDGYPIGAYYNVFGNVLPIVLYDSDYGIIIAGRLSGSLAVDVITATLSGLIITGGSKGTVASKVAIAIDFTDKLYVFSGNTTNGFLYQHTYSLPPAPPSDFTSACSYSRGEILITFKHTGLVDTIHIERSVDGVSFFEIGSVAYPGTLYSDTQVFEGQQYYYRARPKKGGTFYGYTPIVDSTCYWRRFAPCRPILTGADYLNGKIYITWEPNNLLECGGEISTILGYRIWKKRPGDLGYNLLDTYNADVFTAEDGEITASGTMEYRLAAYNEYGESFYTEFSVEYKNTSLLPGIPVISKQSASGANITVQWTSVSNVNGYRLEVRRYLPIYANEDIYGDDIDPIEKLSMDLQFLGLGGWKQIADVGSGTLSHTHTVQDVLNNGVRMFPYQFRVRGYNYSEGDGEYSNILTVSK